MLLNQMLKGLSTKILYGFFSSVEQSVGYFCP